MLGWRCWCVCLYYDVAGDWGVLGGDGAQQTTQVGIVESHHAYVTKCFVHPELGRCSVAR